MTLQPHKRTKLSELHTAFSHWEPLSFAGAVTAHGLLSFLSLLKASKIISSNMTTLSFKTQQVFTARQTMSNTKLTMKKKGNSTMYSTLQNSTVGALDTI